MADEVKVDGYQGKLPDGDALKRKWAKLSNSKGIAKRSGSGGPMTLEQAAIALARRLNEQASIEDMEEQPAVCLGPEQAPASARSQNKSQS